MSGMPRRQRTSTPRLSSGRTPHTSEPVGSPGTFVCGGPLVADWLYRRLLKINNSSEERSLVRLGSLVGFFSIDVFCGVCRWKQLELHICTIRDVG